MATESTYLFVYLSNCVLCSVFAFIILLRLPSDAQGSRDIPYFRKFVIGYIAYAISEVFYALGHSGHVKFSPLTAGLTDAVGMIIIAICAYYWFMYAEERMRKTPLKENKKLYYAAMIPVTLITIMYITSFWTGWIYDTRTGVSKHGPLYWLPVVVDGIYLVYVIVHSLILTSKETTEYRRHDLILITTFALIPLMCAVCDMFIPNTPIMMLGIFSSLFMVFTNILDSRVYNDGLTGLNNRRSADTRCDQMISEASKSKPFYMFIMDIDDFKKINDTYGHNEGDVALRRAGEALSNLAGEYAGSFCARWGGDEFVFLIPCSSITSPEAFERNIHQAIWETKKQYKADYDLTMSVGYSLCTSSTRTRDDLMKEADMMLYRSKQEMHDMLSQPDNRRPII